MLYLLIEVSDFESLFGSRIIRQNYGKNIHKATSYFIIIDWSNGCFSTYLVFRSTRANTLKTNRIFKIENGFFRKWGRYVLLKITETIRFMNDHE